MLDFLKPIQVSHMEKIPTWVTQPAEQPSKVTLDDVMQILRNMQIEQSSMATRMARMETRMVNLMLANGLDTNGKPIGNQR